MPSCGNDSARPRLRLARARTKMEAEYRANVVGDRWVPDKGQALLARDRRTAEHSHSHRSVLVANQDRALLARALRARRSFSRRVRRASCMRSPFGLWHAKQSVTIRSPNRRMPSDSCVPWCRPRDARTLGPQAAGRPARALPCCSVRPGPSHRPPSTRGRAVARSAPSAPVSHVTQSYPPASSTMPLPVKP